MTQPRPPHPFLRPDSSRTVIRPFDVEDPAAFAVPGRPRAERVVDRVLGLSQDELERELQAVLAPLAGRHRELETVLMRRFEELGEAVRSKGASRERSLLIAAYFSEEFSFESAALFNPSIVPDPRAAPSAGGDTRFILSLRGIGEGHISSLTFRTGVWRADGTVSVDDPGRFAVGPQLERTTGADGELIAHLSCEGAEEISELVIYPFMPSQGRGIEDVRMVVFTEDDGSVDVRATYTAFNGSDVRQGLFRTGDFKSFEMRGVLGAMYSGKGMALFPRRVGGEYLMLGRQDNENIWLLRSKDPYRWEGGEKILSPRWPWEFIQMGNCGSPIEIDEGWLVLTHGVGPVRNYCVGACLLDKEDPTQVLARRKEPLLQPEDQDRDGYVPNVVYSCGALLRGRTLLLPYGVADNFVAFTTLGVDEILAGMTP